MVIKYDLSHQHLIKVIQTEIQTDSNNIKLKPESKHVQRKPHKNVISVFFTKVGIHT